MLYNLFPVQTTIQRALPLSLTTVPYPFSWGIICDGVKNLKKGNKKEKKKKHVVVPGPFDPSEAFIRLHVSRLKDARPVPLGRELVCS